MVPNELRTNAIVRGPAFPEPVQILMITSVGESFKIIGKGLNTNQYYDPVLNAEQLTQLSITPEKQSFDGDPDNFRLGVEALRLGLAYEYDPYFSLSIARVDPLPHQLEAVYDYFLKLPRIRFLIADDPGAGKTIMAGLILKELKLRGVVNRILIVVPGHLKDQWRRELKEKFQESFTVIDRGLLNAHYAEN